MLINYAKYNNIAGAVMGKAPYLYSAQTPTFMPSPKDKQFMLTMHEVTDP